MLNFIRTGYVIATQYPLLVAMFSILNGCLCIPERHAVAEKPHDDVVKFYTYRNLQLHRAVLLAAARLSCFKLSVVTDANVLSKYT